MPDDDDDRTTLICSPTAIQDHPLSGSIKGWCQICATEIWLSPQGQDFIRDQPATIVVCLDCGVGLASDEQHLNLQPVPGATRSVPDVRDAVRAVRGVIREARRGKTSPRE